MLLLVPEDRRIAQDILVPPDEAGSAKPGEVVTVDLIAQPSRHAQPIGRVAEVLGHHADPGMEIEIAVRKFDLPHEFSRRALAAARAMPDEVRADDRSGRKDLRELAFVTIDGETARDFDDAVFCRREGKGFRLWVAIADVSHYVRHGDPLDLDAQERGTSVYFPRRVIPMLPEKLSNGLCSLNPEVDRLCMVCDMLITAAGDIHAYQFYPAVMHSHARMTYTEVAAILANTRGPEAARRKDLVPHFLDLHDVYRALLKARNTRGAVDFETTETQIICDENGRIEQIVPRVRNDAHKLIEEAMLAANVCAADFIQQAAHPGLFRVHEGPTPEKKEILRTYLKALAVGLTISDDPTPGEFQKIALATKDRPDAAQISTMLLRSMQQAIYTPINSGHFGLAYEAYTHFTSPIRRYPDLLVHRVIKAILAKERYQLPVLPTPGEAHEKLSRRLAARAAPPTQRPRPKIAASPREMQAWEAAGLHCSANERRADEASRDVEAWLKCKFMRDHLGEEYSGVVTAATSFGIFVTLDALYVEGLVHITELGGEYFKFDEARQELRGERTGIRYAIGTRLRVQVSRVDLDGRKIDFRLVREGEELMARALKEKGVPGTEGVPAKASAKRAAKKATARGKKAAPEAPKSAAKKAASKTRTARKPRR